MLSICNLQAMALPFKPSHRPLRPANELLPGKLPCRCWDRRRELVGGDGYAGGFQGGFHSRMVDFTFPLQLKGTCLPQKSYFALDLVYYMVGIA